jgi:uracil-DNA glycosylase family 4
MSPHAPGALRRTSTFSPFSQSFRRVPGEGPEGVCECVLIGERPGQEEARRGRPFVGPSGMYLDTCLNVANLSRASIYITNLVKTFNQYGKPTPSDIAADHDELVQEILTHDPRVIGLVGGWSVEAVLGREHAEMEKVHGVPLLVRELFGGELTFSSLVSARTEDVGAVDGWLVLPMMHPANCIYSPEVMGAVLDDFLRLAQLLDGEIGPVVDEIAEPDYRVLDAGELRRMLP